MVFVGADVHKRTHTFVAVDEVHRRDQIRLKGLGQVYHRKRIAAGASKTEAYVASNATSPASSTTTTQTTET